MKTNVITLNSSNLHNVTIIGLALRYTRQIDRKFYTIEIHSDSNDEVIKHLSALSSLDNNSYMLACKLHKDLACCTE